MDHEDRIQREVYPSVSGASRLAAYPDGAVCLFDHRHRVGAAYRGEVVRVRLAVESLEWVFEPDGHEVGRAPARQESPERICGLPLSRRPGRSAARKGTKVPNMMSGSCCQT